MESASSNSSIPFVPLYLINVYRTNSVVNVLMMYSINTSKVFHSAIIAPSHENIFTALLTTYVNFKCNTYRNSHTSEQRVLSVVLYYLRGLAT